MIRSLARATARAGAVLLLLAAGSSAAPARSPTRAVIAHCSLAVQHMKLKNANRRRHDLLRACEVNGGTIPGRMAARSGARH